MSGNRYIPTIFTATDSNGAPIAGAKLYFYENGTTTPKDTYSDIDLTVPNEWPVIADGAGRFTVDIFMDTDAYRVKLTDENDVQIWQKDDCNTFNGAAQVAGFPFAGAVIEFYGTQNQLNAALADFWYLMDGNNGLPNLNNTYVKTCISVADIGLTGGSNTPTGSVGSHVLTTAELPQHSHFVANVDTSTTALSAANYMAFKGNPGTSFNYEMYGSTTAATIGKTSDTGSASGHTHTLTMNTYDPPYYKLIKLVYLGY
jgi:hypothetical protein